MRIAFMGTPEFALPALHALFVAHEVLAVYSQPPRPAGRGKQPRLTPVHSRAERLGLPVRTPVTLRSAAEQRAFAALQADVAVVVAYGLILPPEVLAAPRHGCLNIHASLLPRWRGAAPIHRAIMAGDSETGVSIMQMDAGLDTGPVLLREATPIGPEDTTGDLHDRLADMGSWAILRALKEIGRYTPEPQSDTGATYAERISKAEARVDWSRPAVEVDRKIRGLSPFPGAWCETPAGRLKLLRSRLASGSGAPGEVLDGLTVACGDGAVEITLAQREGKRPMPAADLLLGMKLPQGSRLH